MCTLIIMKVEHGQAIDIKVIKAFELNENCNNIYKIHFKDTQVCTKNIESLDIDDIPKANIWLLSPPCHHLLGEELKEIPTIIGVNHFLK